MNQSSFGNKFVITTWGESHGKALGAVVDGCPAGLPLTEDDIQKYLDRRKPGQGPYATARKEGDQVEILSGVFEGRTTGTPISMAIFNKDQRSRDYGNIAYTYRPGHADYTFDEKYGFRDYRGGGRSSGRETAGRVAGGAVALKLLESLGINVFAYVSAVGPAAISSIDKEERDRNSLCMPDAEAFKKAAAWLDTCIHDQDSSGGVIECRITGVPAGLGDPVFGKLDAALAGAMMSIGAVKAVEIGDGVLVGTSRGSLNNDSFYMEADGSVAKASNHSGGILGGISDGSELFFRVHVKPTPSISLPQKTITNDHQDTTLEIHGRHDPIIAPRAVVVVEAMAALVLADALLSNISARLESVQRFHKP